VVRSVDAVYEPGSSVAIAGPTAWVVAGVAPGHACVAACWAAVRRGAPVEDVLDALIGGGLGSAPSFAFAQHHAGSWRVVVRGTGTAAVTVDGRAVQTVRAVAGTTWTDTIAVGEVENIELSTEAVTPTGALVLPLTAGVLMAGRLRLTATGLADSTSFVSSADVEDPSVLDRPRADRVQDGGVLDVPEAPAHVPTQEVAEPPDPAFVDAALDPPEATEPEPQAGETVPSYDHLFGATSRPTELEPPLPSPPDPSPPAWETLPPPAEPALEPASAERAPEPARAEPVPAGLIASFPFAVGVPSAVPGPSSLPPPTVVPHSAPHRSPPDQVLQTTDRASLLRELASAGPSVLASRCPLGHLSPANASSCRVCRAAVSPQEPVETPRPVLGALRLSTGDVVTLDRGVVLGRAPEAGDGERPHLVKVLSPSGDISRVHLEVVLEGWHVLVRDLGSTNGSTVSVPGEAPVRVRAHELVAIEPGTEVSLADEVSFRFEVTP
jgi:hypothetical protein